MVCEETFLRNFRFYAKTLTKLHDLTVGPRLKMGSTKTACPEVLFDSYRTFYMYLQGRNRRADDGAGEAGGSRPHSLRRPRRSHQRDPHLLQG